MKYTPDFILHLSQRLHQPLPGLDVQMEMAPSIRDRDWPIPDDARKSAILALLYPYQEDLHLAFMKRKEDGRVHAGQLCFPGGRYEQSDRDYIHTALREAEEEMGIPQKDVQVLGSLSRIYIPPSNSLVFPAVGFIHTRPRFVAEPEEVAQIIEVSIEQLFDEQIKGVHRVDVFQGNFIDAPGYTVNEQHIIWGGTAMMLAELVAIVKEVRADVIPSK